MSMYTAIKFPWTDNGK